MQGFSVKILPAGLEIFTEKGGLTLLSRPIPELPLRPERK